mmetsp:Transcript_39517/g.100968  ORF Transcript_39517/g.100968 Transcript_39517/m.100968 type:complete len:205 (-) Transcript_39517:354-968(-)
MDPLRPQRRLAEPLPGLHRRRDLLLHGRRVRGLHVVQRPAHQAPGAVDCISGQEEIVLRPQETEADGLCASPLREVYVDAHPEPEKWVSSKMWPLDGEAQLRSEGGREHVEDLDLLLCEALADAEALLRLLLHPHSNALVDSVLIQVLPQRPQALRLLLLHHLEVDHRCGQRGHNCAAEEEADHHREDVEDPLEAVLRVQFNAS